MYSWLQGLILVLYHRYWLQVVTEKKEPVVPLKCVWDRLQEPFE